MECGLDLDNFPPFVWSIEPRRSIPAPPPKDPFDLVAAADTAPAAAAAAAARRLLPFLSRLLAPFFARPRPSFAPEEEDDDDNDDDDDDDNDDDDDDDSDDDKEGEGGGAPINSRRCFSNSSDVNMPRRNASSRRDRAPNGSLPIRRCRRCCRPL